MSDQQASTCVRHVDAAYFYVAPRISRGEAVEQHIIDRPQRQIILDFNRDDELLGVEILGASALLSQATIEGLQQLEPWPVTRRRHSCNGFPARTCWAGYGRPMTDEWTINHFSQSNPVGDAQGDVPALLRRVADTIERLGTVRVQDITFASEVTDAEDDLTMTVYYHPAERSHLTLLQ